MENILVMTKNVLKEIWTKFSIRIRNLVFQPYTMFLSTPRLYINDCVNHNGMVKMI